MENKKLKQLAVNEFLNTRYKDYSKYVLYSRSIPNMIDGFKPSQRKIIYTAIKSCNKNLLKSASLAGSVISVANYHHGNASLEDAINGLVQPFKNNVPWLSGKGSFGSRLIPIAAAARYTFTKMNQDFYNYFTDFEVCNDSIDPENPEPQFYLPIIPTVLLNGVSGIAVGYSTDILPRNSKDLANACKKVLNGQDISSLELTPYFKGFKGTIEKVNGKYISVGRFSRTKRKNEVLVEDVPIGIDREKYVEILHKLEDDGVIKNFTDSCSKVGFNFTIKLVADTKNLSDKEISDKLRLSKPLKENITVIDFNGNIKVYDSPHQLIIDFCKYRITKYKDRFQHWIERDTQLKRKVDIKIAFISAVISGKIVVSGKSKKQLKEILTKTNLQDEEIETLLKMPIYTLCQDGLDEYKEKSKQLADNIKKWNISIPKDEFIKELGEIK